MARTIALPHAARQPIARLAALSGVFLALCASPAWAIHCERAQTPQEIAICSHAELKAFNDYLTQAYADLRGMLPKELFDRVRRSQREWIQHRDQRCGADVQCLIQETHARTAALNGLAQEIAEELRQPQDGQAPEPQPPSPRLTPQHSTPQVAAGSNSDAHYLRMPQPKPRNQAPQDTAEAALSPTQIYQIAAQSVVVVMAYAEKSQGVSQGSGVVIAPDTIATNCHVIEGAQTPVVIFQGNPYESELIAGNARMDYCVLRTSGLPARVAQVDRYTSITPGQRVYSIGSPRGFELTIAEGLVSGLRDQEGVPMIQTSAAISPGSSGGGLFNEQGRVIGITTFLLKDSQNINFALPVELAEKLD